MTTQNANLSFASILARVNAAQATTVQAVQAVATVATSATAKTVDAAKAVGSAIHGVMPVSHNVLDARTEKIFTVVEEQGMQIDMLYAAMGITKPVLPATDLSALVAARMASIKASTPAPAPVVPVVAPVVPQVPVVQAPVVPTAPLGVNVAASIVAQPVAIPQAPVTPQVPVQAPVVVAPTLNTPALQAPLQIAPVAPRQPFTPGPQMGIAMSQPSNWHQQ